jgi:hypothetical protein
MQQQLANHGTADLMALLAQFGGQPTQGSCTSTAGAIWDRRASKTQPTPAEDPSIHDRALQATYVRPSGCRTLSCCQPPEPMNPRGLAEETVPAEIFHTAPSVALRPEYAAIPCHETP